ncbi:hypothetical protein [Denitratisoma oestradiolicum]|nr:hypothetical protein [Denitratisoma oestradiolicum]
MALSDFESEDVALLASVAIATIAAVIDTFYGSPVFKALKILSLFLSLGLAYHRIKTSKPYFKDMPESAWKAVGQQYEVRISKSEHGRGKSPHARCLVPGQTGGFAECWADAEVGSDGEVVVQVNSPAALRIEIRK